MLVLNVESYIESGVHKVIRGGSVVMPKPLGYRPEGQVAPSVYYAVRIRIEMALEGSRGGAIEARVET